MIPIIYIHNRYSVTNRMAVYSQALSIIDDPCLIYVYTPNQTSIYEKHTSLKFQNVIETLKLMQQINEANVKGGDNNSFYPIK